MLKRLKQFRKLWTLATKNAGFMEALEKTSEKDIEKMPSRGDGKAVFMPEMTPADLEKYQHEVKNGWKTFNDLVRRLTP